MNFPELDATQTHTIHFKLNGQRVAHEVLPRTHLVDFLRDGAGLKGSHLGCEHGVCGACTVQMDGQIVRGCLVLAVQADGRSVNTIEGLSESGALRELQQAFIRHNALQCGFCTSGMLLAAHELVEHQPHASREQVREWISGNYCRCTGYQAIVDAICEVLSTRLQEVAA
jgi:aerobic-type carbon monoxide dehydrogenase small subunit (CoxS/CutS family)